MVNGLLGADVSTTQPLMEAGLDSIGAHADPGPSLRSTAAAVDLCAALSLDTRM